MKAPSVEGYVIRAFVSQLTLGSVLFILPSSAKAQMSQTSLRSRQMSQTAIGYDNTTTSNETDCATFINTKFNGVLTATMKTRLNGCVTALQNNIPDPGGLAADIDSAITALKETYHLTSPDQVDEQLITTHYLLRVLRRWANVDADAEAAQLTILDSLDMRLQTMMKYVGLLDPFAGFLVAGPVFGETGKLSSGNVSANATGSATTTTATAATSAGSNTTALAHIEWGSKHFLDQSWSHFDFSFGGSFGLQPALTLLTNPPASTSTAASPAPTTSQYQSAFIWDVNGKTNLHTGSNAEMAGFFRVGQLRLLTGNGATIVDQGANSTLQIPLNGNANRMSWFYEAGVEWNYYSKSLEIIHAEKGQLDPAFNIGVSYKIDTRFTQNAGVVGFNSPDRRFNFRFLINGLKVFDKRPDTTASKPYAISFGVEYERGGLFCAVENQGHTLNWPKEPKANLVVVVDSQRIAFCLSEIIEHKTHVLTKQEAERRKNNLYDYSPKWDYVGTGRLRLSIESVPYGVKTIRKSWSDGRTQQLESCLGDFIVTLSQVAAAIKFDNEERERRHQRWMDEQKRAEEERRLQAEYDRSSISWRKHGVKPDFSANLLRL